MKEKAIAIGPYKITESTIRLASSAKDSIEVVFQYMKRIATVSIAFFSLLIGLFATPSSAVVGGADATGSGFVVAIRID